MTVFPIHIIELLTLALILLGIYQVFKALSFESSQSESRHSHVTPESETPHKAGQKQTIEKTILENQRFCEPAKMCAQQPETHTPKAQPTGKTHQPCNQTVLNNYIGDFF